MALIGTIAKAGVLCGLVVSLAAAIAAAAAAETSPAELIAQRYRATLLEKAPPAAAVVERLVRSLDANGAWPDIDYAHKARTAWTPRTHLSRIAEMSAAYVHPDSPARGSAPVRQAITRALDHWHAKRYQCPNWWYNRIGCPKVMRDILMLLGPAMTGDERDKALTILRQCEVGMTGANLIDTAEIRLHDGAMTGNVELIARCARLIADEIRISSGEGIRPDFSFHQHGPRLMQFSYGSVFIGGTTRLAVELRGTPWALPQEKIDLLAEYVLSGSQWMVRGTGTVPDTMDRGASRKGALAHGDMRPVVERILAAGPSPRLRAGLEAFHRRQSGRGPVLVGYRYWPYSEFGAWHRQAFALMIKPTSTRTRLSESINSENQLGRLMDCGTTYFLRAGDEYFDMMPVWDWDLVPGVTWAVGAGELIQKPFVGSVSAGDDVAVIAMDCAFGDKKSAALSARKAWAMHGEAMVCLIANLTAGKLEGPVRTALDQCRQAGQVVAAEAGKSPRILPDGTHELTRARWVLHNGLAYVPLSPAKMTVKVGPVTGDWHRINRQYDDRPVTDRVFLPVLEHGADPQGQSCGYAVAAVADAAAAEALAARPPWTVLANTAARQAVRFNSGSIVAVFYEAGTLTDAAGKTILTVSAPCLIAVRGRDVFATDPAHKGLDLTITTADGGQRKVALPADGTVARPAAAGR